ncbi:hypothetical protein Ddye_012447 [Dipteronia dyeriana]|uniref:RNase H type-1 domain-containing protein n=1 Tax=Dipteronia dyeriana TaxID=168575 RepID=A0AAD9X4C6_9ROSI|nr:hypothetical protein Ddye_012447 [Dipteronia dyeriana]
MGFLTSDVNWGDFETSSLVFIEEGDKEDKEDVEERDVVWGERMSKEKLGWGLSSVKGVFCPLGVCFAFEAELAAGIYAIDYAWTFGWRRLWLESDSTFVVDILRSRSRKVSWRWSTAWDRCLGLISQMDFALTHIYREGNQAADSLAYRRPNIVSLTWWWNAPNFCNPFIFNDFCSRPSFRLC